MAPSNGTSSVARLTLAIPEQRLELGLSLNGLAKLSGVNRSTISKIERGGNVDPALVVKVASTLNTLELASLPKDDPPGAMVFDLERALGAWVVDAGGVAHQMRGAA